MINCFYNHLSHFHIPDNCKKLILLLWAFSFAYSWQIVIFKIISDETLIDYLLFLLNQGGHIIAEIADIFTGDLLRVFYFFSVEDLCFHIKLYFGSQTSDPPQAVVDFSFFHFFICYLPWQVHWFLDQIRTLVPGKEMAIVNKLDIFQFKSINFFKDFSIFAWNVCNNFNQLNCRLSSAGMRHIIDNC